MTQPISEPRKRPPGLAGAFTRPIGILLVLQMLSGMVLAPQRAFFPLYIRELGLPVMLISGLAAGQQVMGLLGAWLGGALSDTLGHKRTLLLGQLGGVLASLAFLSPATAAIVPLWIVSGLFGGLHTVGGQSLLIGAAEPAFLGVFSAFYNWGNTLGGAIGSPLAGLVLERWDYRLFGLLLSFTGMLAMALNVALLPRVRPVEAPSAGRALLRGYADVARRPTALTLALIRFLPTFYWGMALILIPLLLNDAGASLGTVALYATLSQLLAAGSQLVVGRAADRLGRRGVTATTLVVLIVSILGTGLLAGSLRGVFLFGSLSTMAAWSLSTLMPSLVADATPFEERGRTLGWVHLWWNLGMIAGSLVGGALFRWGAGVPFVLAALLNLGTLALLARLFQSVEAGN